MGQLMSHHGLLLVDRHPVQQVHLLGLVVVEARNLLGQQAQQKRPQLKVAIQQPELLQHQLAALHPLVALVLVELLAQLLVYRVARDEPALHRRLDRQQRVLTHELQDLLLRPQQLLLLVFGQLGVDHDARLPALQHWRGRLAVAAIRRRRLPRRHPYGQNHHPRTPLIPVQSASRRLNSH